MGKAAKEHRRRVKARNERLKVQENVRKKMLTQMFEQYTEQLKQEREAATSATTTENDMGFIQPDTSI